MASLSSLETRFSSCVTPAGLTSALCLGVSSSEITPQVQKHFQSENRSGVPEGRVSAQAEEDVEEFVCELQGCSRKCGDGCE